MEIRECVLRYLTAKDRTSEEVRGYLSGRGYEGGQIAAEIEFLKECHYIDDGAYALRYVEMAVRKGKGLLGVQRELEQKGIDQEMLEEAFFECGITNRFEYEKGAALEAALDLAGAEEPSEKLFGRIGRKLVARGFGSEAIYYAVGKVMNAAEREEL